MTDKQREKQRETARRYRANNKEKIRAMKLKYEAQPHRREKKREKSKQEYLDNREKILKRTCNRRQERKKIIDDISLKYSCQNPNCLWKGSFDPFQLTFHHVNRSEKTVEVAKMHSWSIENIIKEINKCCVLCRNCHPLADKGILIIADNMMCKEEINEHLITFNLS